MGILLAILVLCLLLVILILILVLVLILVILGLVLILVLILILVLFVLHDMLPFCVRRWRDIYIASIGLRYQYRPRKEDLYRKGQSFIMVLYSIWSEISLVAEAVTPIRMAPRQRSMNQ